MIHLAHLREADRSSQSFQLTGQFQQFQIRRGVEQRISDSVGVCDIIHGEAFVYPSLHFAVSL